MNVWLVHLLESAPSHSFQSQAAGRTGTVQVRANPMHVLDGTVSKASTAPQTCLLLLSVFEKCVTQTTAVTQAVCPVVPASVTSTSLQGPVVFHCPLSTHRQDAGTPYGSHSMPQSTVRLGKPPESPPSYLQAWGEISGSCQEEFTGTWDASSTAQMTEGSRRGRKARDGALTQWLG